MGRDGATSSTDPVSIIIPALNEERYLLLLLNSLIKIHVPMDVVVVDGGSRDGTVAVATAFEDKFSGNSSLRVITSERGISRQRNAGAAVARHDVLIFMDADTVVPDGESYAELLRKFLDSGYAVAAPYLAPAEGGIRARFIYWFFNECVRAVLLLRGDAYFAGSCMLTRMSVFTSIGGFSVSKIVAEDIDYSARAQKCGGAGLFKTPVLVSARRFIKYGYGRMFWFYFKEGILFLVRGVPRYDKATSIYYFGEYDA